MLTSDNQPGNGGNDTAAESDSLPAASTNADACASISTQISASDASNSPNMLSTATDLNSGSATTTETTSTPAIHNLVTQVKQSAEPTNPIKSSIEAAKRRVAKLEVKNEQSATQPTSTVIQSSQPVHGTIASTVTISPTQGISQSSPISNVAPVKSKKAYASHSSFWSAMFPCCCYSPDNDMMMVPISSVTKPPSGTQKAPSPSGFPTASHPSTLDTKKYLLKELAAEDVGRKCLVLDLDETLVHSSFKPVAKADFIIPVEIDKTIHNVYVLKRPGVDTFLQRLGTQFEVVVFTASLAKYADPVLDMLDKHKVVKHRLFREACIHHKGNYVKDLSLLGRNLKDVIIIDNSPSCYLFHPANAIPITSWFEDPSDAELLDLIPFLEDLKLVDNVTVVLDNSLDDQ
ncbi:hypothetical protein BDV3_000677 [Batrachochytrium dendrobatidis]|uniref:protein-serine/threonine phosphatase n=2 Tax=Batrachochytrium dendrobatidis TaxID=109871 RepID=A0A177W8E9_BATDL|nr:hypothetical protein O5D80_000451 [Batrachochytrium dendrobatidis]KAK5671988.1 hypothetical protein QVD99_001808 [Batrachochytrium dendrobatidis]OAJ36015.1 hypothetical protein BDEG_20235 [Batrachochytrium dendrobatidis JEL423]